MLIECPEPQDLKSTWFGSILGNRISPFEFILTRLLFDKFRNLC